MQSPLHNVKVLHATTGETLFECPVEEMEKAFTMAKELENYGIDIKISSPTITNTLAQALGVQGAEAQVYERSVLEELENHDQACCAGDVSGEEGEFLARLKD